MPRLLARAPQDQPLGRAGAQHPPGDGHGGAGPGLRWFRGGSEAGDGRWEQGLGSFLQCCWGCFGPPQGTGAASAPDTQAQPRSPKRRALRPQAPSTVSPRAELDVPKHGWGRAASNRSSPSPQAQSPASLSPVAPKLRVPKPQTPWPQAWCPQAPSQVPGASLLPSNPASPATTLEHLEQGTAQSGVTPPWPSARGGHGVRGPLGCHPETPLSPLPEPWGRYSPGRRAAVGACCTLTGAREERERSV